MKKTEYDMTKRKYRVRAECPACACGDTSDIPPEVLRQKFIGNEKEIDILCPTCGEKHTGQIVEEAIENSENEEVE